MSRQLENDLLVEDYGHCTPRKGICDSLFTVRNHSSGHAYFLEENELKVTAWIGLVYLRRIYLSPSDGIAIQERTVEFPVLCLRKVRLRERCGGRDLETQDVPLSTLRAVA